VEAILSFTGYSVGPSISTWGGMIADGLVTVFQQPTGLIYPMLCIVITVLGANLLADGLRRQLDPRLLGRTDPRS
jgi:peptide/nickel transport system permease protein